MRRESLLLLVGAVVVCAWCGWVSGFHRDTLAAEVTWLVSVGAVVAIDVGLWAGRKGLRWGWHLDPAADPWPRPDRGGGGPAALGTAPWLGLVLIALAWDVLALDTSPRQYHLTISALSQAYRPLNAGLLFIWLGVGVGYGATRARAPWSPTRLAAEPPGATPHASSAAVFGMASVTMSSHHALGGRALPGLLLPEVPAVGVAFWVALPVAAIVIDQMTRRSGGRFANAEEFLRFISTAMPAKVLLVAAWGFAGYHLFAR